MSSRICRNADAGAQYVVLYVSRKGSQLIRVDPSFAVGLALPFDANDAFLLVSNDVRPALSANSAQYRARRCDPKNTVPMQRMLEAADSRNNARGSPRSMNAP